MLPESVQNLVRLIGYGRAMDMVREMGGNEFRFPVRPEGHQYDWLVEVVGPGAAKLLHDHYQGEILYIPLCKRALIADRDRLMIARYEELIRSGLSGRAAVAAIVTDTRFRPISNRSVEKIVNRPAPPGMREMAAQGSLF